MNSKLPYLVLALLISSSSFAMTDKLWIVSTEGDPGDLVSVDVWLRYNGGGEDDSMSGFDLPLTWDASVCSVEAITLGYWVRVADWMDASRIDNQGTMGPPSIPKLTLSAHRPETGECVSRGTRKAATIDFRIVESVVAPDSTCLDTLMEAFAPPVNLRLVDKDGATSYVPSFSTGCIRYVVFRDSVWIAGREGVPGGLVPVQVWLQYQGGGSADSIAAFDIPLTWDATVCTVEAITRGSDFGLWVDQFIIDNSGTSGSPPVPKICVCAFDWGHPWAHNVERGTHLAATVDFRILDVATPSDSACIDTLEEAFSWGISPVFANHSGSFFYTPSFSPGCIAVASCTCGDTNGDGRITVADAIYISTYIYKGGHAPACEGDVNQDERITSADAIYLLTYIYRDGPEPCNP